MLSAPDAAVVRRDRDLPGLSVLLDPAAFLEVLAGAFPWLSCTAATALYVRYKPGGSCLSLYRMFGPAGPIDVYAKAFKRGRGEKLRHWRTEPGARNRGQRYRRVDERWQLGISIFPDDRRLKALRRLNDSSTRDRIIAAARGRGPEPGPFDLTTLRYKPERRYVASVAHGGTLAEVLKMYDERGYRSARASAGLFGGGQALRIPRLTGESASHRVLLFEWMSGRSLQEELAGAAGLEGARVTGAALAELHGQDGPPSMMPGGSSIANAAHSAARAVALVHPPLAARVESLAQRIAGALNESGDARTSHGDFYAEQVIVNGDGTASFLDFDRVCLAPPAADLGTFAAHLHSAVVRGLQSPERADAAIESVLRGYGTRRPVPAPAQLRAFTAAALLRLAPEPFRRREDAWVELTEAIVERAGTILDSAERTPARRAASGTHNGSVHVDDPHDLASDPAWAFFRPALDPREAQRSLVPALRRLGARQADLREIRVTRLKPGRRCVLEYAFDSDVAPGNRPLVLVGKSRIKGVNGNAQFALESLWNEGFRPGESPVCVPQPLGGVPAWRMTVQRKIDGSPAGERLRDPDGPRVAARIAEAIRMLHTRGVPPVRSHTLEDELRILSARLAEVRDRLGARRVDKVLRECELLAAQAPSAGRRPIHRDFYPAQVIVEPERVWLIDLDLYCAGDPGLDVGNFLAHMIEERVRRNGFVEDLSDTESAFESRYVELAGQRTLPSIRAFTTLSLARHVYLSTQFPERRHTTHALLDLCERRLAAGIESRRYA